MTPALLILSGTVLTIVASVAAVLGAPLSLIAGGYLISGFIVSVIVLTAALRSARHTGRDARYYSEIEAEIIALRESASRDRRFGAGSPEALSPVLHRSLKAREEAQYRARSPRSELDIRIRS